MPLESSVLADHRDRIYDFSLRFLGCREDAADVTQDVLVRFWQSGEQIEETRRTAWVMRVTRNACLDFLRRKHTRRAYTPTTNAPENFETNGHAPDRLVESADIAEQIEEALHAMGEPYRSLVVLREIHGLSYEELSEALELPLATTKVYLHRARKRLRDGLRKVLPAEELTP